MEMKKGEWYFVVTCDNCGKSNPVGLAPSPKQQAVTGTFPTEVHCDCGTHKVYPPERIDRIQHR